MGRVWIFLLLGLLLGACTKNEVTLTFQLPADYHDPVRVIYYASGKNGGTMRETAAEIVGGKGELKLPERYPSLLYIFPRGSNMPAAVVYIRRGDKIKITGTDANVTRWNATGNAATEALSAWRIKNEKTIASGSPKALNAAVKEFVESNPDSPAAAIALYVYYDRREDAAGFLALQGLLGRKVTGDKDLMNALSFGDLLSDLPMEVEIPAEIILGGEDGYADTLSLRSGMPTLLVFRGMIRGAASEIPADSLRALATRYKGKRQLAEIILESDSLNWRRHLRKDTIEGLQRLWMPYGMADTVALAMQVRTLPLYIVIDAKGKEVSRTALWEEAVKKFKKIK